MAAEPQDTEAAPAGDGPLPPALAVKELVSEMRNPQLLDVLEKAGDFLYNQGVSEGASACDVAVNLLPHAAAVIERQQHELDKAALLAEARWRGLLPPTQAPPRSPDSRARMRAVSFAGASSNQECSGNRQCIPTLGSLRQTRQRKCPDQA